jgi:hypothetical protein
VRQCVERFIINTATTSCSLLFLCIRSHMPYAVVGRRHRVETTFVPTKRPSSARINRANVSSSRRTRKPAYSPRFRAREQYKFHHGMQSGPRPMAGYSWRISREQDCLKYLHVYSEAIRLERRVTEFGKMLQSSSIRVPFSWSSSTEVAVDMP